MFLLELAPQPALPVPHALDLRATVALAIGIGRDICDGEIHAEKGRHRWGRSYEVAGRGQVERPVAQDQIGFALPELQKFKLSWAGGERNLEPAAFGADRYRAGMPAQNTVVVTNRAGRREDAHRVPVELVGVHDLRHTTNRHLSGQRETASYLSIQQRLDAVAREFLGAPSLLADPVTRCVGGPQGVFKTAKLRRIGEQLYFGDQLQMLTVSPFRKRGPGNCTERTNVHRLKAVESNLELLT
jgi:hypothetical protein